VATRSAFRRIVSSMLPIAGVVLATMPSCSSGGSGTVPPAPAGNDIVRVSIAAGGAQTDDHSDNPSIGLDGRWVAFESDAGNIDTASTTRSIFLHDRQGHATVLVSVADNNEAGNDLSSESAVSDAGRFVAFLSQATNLVPGDANGFSDIFLRDTRDNTTVRVSVSDAGDEADSGSDHPSIGGDGARVAFQSTATNLASPAGTGIDDIYVRNLPDNTTRRASLAWDNTLADGSSSYPLLSRNGRFVAFYSEATNLVTGDNNASPDVFVRDLQTGVTERVSVAWDNAELPSGARLSTPHPRFPPMSISSDGRFVAFMTAGNGVVPTDNNGVDDVFLRDRLRGTTEIVSVTPSGAPGNDRSEYPWVSDDGRYVVFRSYATDIAPALPNPHGDDFLRDRQAGVTRRIGLTHEGVVADICPGRPRISGDGTVVTFSSPATNLVPGDTNRSSDIFVVLP